MAKPKVFVTRRVPQEGIDILNETCDVDVWDSDDVVPRETLLERVKDVNGLFCTINDKIDEEVLDAAGNIILLKFCLNYFVFLLEIEIRLTQNIT